MSKFSEAKLARIIFITGTDTGAGKTLLTALLLDYLRKSGHQALAMKPFCSGSLGDVKLLSSVQNHELSNKLVNPFYFEEPIAPLIAARKKRGVVDLAEVVARIREVQKLCNCLLIEGSGGLLVPLGEGYSGLDIIKHLGCSVIIAARNRLGVINHSMMTITILEHNGIKDITLVLMGCNRSDISARSNKTMLQELWLSGEVHALPFLGGRSNRLGAIEKNQKKNKKTLAQILGTAKLCPRSSGTSSK